MRSLKKESEEVTEEKLWFILRKLEESIIDLNEENNLNLNMKDLENLKIQIKQELLPLLSLVKSSEPQEIPNQVDNEVF